MSRYQWLSITLLCLLGCTKTPPPPSGAAEKPKAEADLAFTNLTKKAYVALEIKTQKIEVKPVHERLTLTGWVMAKPGNEVTLTAPAAGYVEFAKGRNVPIAGDTVHPKDELLRLKPVLSPVEHIQLAALKRGVEGDLIKAKTTLKNAESEYNRMKGLFADNLRSKQELDLAQKAHDHAIEELNAAKDKLKFFELPDIPILAPQKGIILQTPIGAGQYVPASAPLVTIIDLNPIWIRVPVPEYDLPQIDPKQKVSITWKNPQHDPKAKSAYWTATPTGRVAQVDPLKHTADLWYELEPSKGAERFVKDQMVTVQMPIGRLEKATVVPYSAIVFDTHGHAWIYLERSAKNDKHQFERRPVELMGSEGDDVIVRTTLTGGESVVTQGAAKLFSRDFFKTPLPGEDH